MSSLEDLTKNACVAGVAPDGLVTVEDAKWMHCLLPYALNKRWETP